MEAGSVSYEPGTGRYLLEGGAVLRRGAVVLRARTARYDPATSEVVATGDVLLTDATRAVAADGVTAVLGGPFEAKDVVAFLKDGPVALGETESIDAARRVGRNRLSLSGRSMRGDRSGRLKLSGARLTLCDCGPGHAPSWEIRAGEADVIPGKRATLSWPVLYVTPRFLFVDRPVPVLALPWLYVPLGDRQTGLLLPEIASTGATGFAVALPLFVTLGRSADLTLTPGYAFGRSRSDVAKGKPAVRGPDRAARGTLGAGGRCSGTRRADVAPRPRRRAGRRVGEPLRAVRSATRSASPAGPRSAPTSRCTATRSSRATSRPTCSRAARATAGPTSSRHTPATRSCWRRARRTCSRSSSRRTGTGSSGATSTCCTGGLGRPRPSCRASSARCGWRGARARRASRRPRRSTVASSRALWQGACQAERRSRSRGRRA